MTAIPFVYRPCGRGLSHVFPRPLSGVHQDASRTSDVLEHENSSGELWRHRIQPAAKPSSEEVVKREGELGDVGLRLRL